MPTCLCSELPVLAPKLEIVVVRHMLERKKSTNSARWAALALPNSRIVEYGLPGERLDFGELVVPGTWMLYPHGEPTPPPTPLPSRLIVVDGSWTQARRILQRVHIFRGMPRFSLAPPAPRARLRAQHLEAGMSTLEAIAGAYTQLGEPEVGAALERLYDNAVARAEKIRGRRTVLDAPRNRDRPVTDGSKR